jgi:hypothetical protein
VRITAVEWSGGDVPPGETALFTLVGSSADAGTYALPVRQTYSDGTVVDWAGAADSDAPAPEVEVLSSLGESSSTLPIIALIVGAVGVLLGGAALVTRGRPAA